MINHKRWKCIRVLDAHAELCSNMNSVQWQTVNLIWPDNR
jgi:hypothetical protein